MHEFILHIDRYLLATIRRVAFPSARIALFIIFFWFGLLKVLHASPADPLVAALLTKTMPFVPFEHFVVFLGFFEMLVGVLFLLPGISALVAFLLLLPHMLSTFLPLVFLPDMTWQGFFAPTMEGQYIIKNILIIALAIGIVAHLHPPHLRKKK